MTNDEGVCTDCEDQQAWICQEHGVEDCWQHENASVSAELVEAGAAGIHDGRVAELKRLYGVESPYYQMYSSMGWEQCDETTKRAYRQEARWVLEAVARVEGITS